MAKSAYTVALTGGIASGKTTVAERFAALGAGIVDADVVSRELVEPGSDALRELVAAFGNDILNSNGALDRGAMRRRIFEQPASRATLEGILHPRVRAELRTRSLQSAADYVMLVVPLLVEGGHYGWVDRIAVVDVPRSTQLARLLLRDGIDAELAVRMLDAQATREDRLSAADDVIDNDGPVENLDPRVAVLHRHYQKFAAAEHRA